MLQWDALGGVKGGVLASTDPYQGLLGVQLGGYAEGGYRFLPSSAWSPYVGARLAGDLQFLDPLATMRPLAVDLNDLDGVGGLNLSGALRVAAGASLLAGPHSLLLVAFVQESGQAAATVTPAGQFTEVGVGARFDLAHSIFASVEGLWGRAALQTDAGLHMTDQATHVEVNATFRKIFRNGMWLRVDGSLAEDTDHVVYTPGLSYDSAEPLVVGLTISYGFPLGRQE